MQKIIQYLKDVRSELSKVTWPSKADVQGATLLVVFLSVVISIYVYGVDQAMTFIVGLIQTSIRM
ncbi:MAG: preprotein translocase subunit SecE [Fibrobacter sp.]|jgi:preprotein translocase subunit SecE|nr:preprotein translocase subunit SecE [Fibrobacter sp.]